MKTVHIAEVIAEGGRDGIVESPDGGFRAELSSDPQPGNVTPEHLFGAAYAACFLGSLKNHAKEAHVSVDGFTVVAKTYLEEDGKGEYSLHIDLRAAMPGLNRNDAQHLLNLAHQTCPYSKATRGNIIVNLSFD